jgi:hypothetical protein
VLHILSFVPTILLLWYRLRNISDMLNLNCWILGDDPKRVFSIEIAKTKTVAALKKGINIPVADTPRHPQSDPNFVDKIRNISDPKRHMAVVWNHRNQ